MPLAPTPNGAGLPRAPRTAGADVEYALQQAVRALREHVGGKQMHAHMVAQVAQWLAHADLSHAQASRTLARLTTLWTGRVSPTVARALPDLLLPPLWIPGEHVDACLGVLTHVACTCPTVMVPFLPRLLPIGGSPNLLALLASHAAVVPLWQALFAQSEGLWAMARPSAKSATFTSHSERVGTWVLDTRAALVDALDAAPPETAVLLLQCVDALVAHTHASPLCSSHAEALRASVERWCAVRTTMVDAYRVLARWPEPPADAMPRLLALLQTCAPPVAEQAWRVAAEWAAEACTSAWLAQLESDVDAAPQRRAGAAYMLGRLLAAQALHHTNDAPRLCALVPRLSGDAYEPVLLEVCRLWPEYAQVLGADARCAAVLDRLRHASAPVRAECARAVGVWVERAAQPGPPALRAWLSEHLWGDEGLVHDAALSTRARAMWALANWCAVAAHYAPVLQQVALRALPDDERVAVHAVRAVGSLVRLAPASEVEALLRAARALVTRDHAPKVRWNAMACVARVLEREQPTPPAAWAVGVQCMAAALDDPLFKVKRIALQALVGVSLDVWGALPSATRDAVRVAADVAQAQLDEAVQHATS
ncbi:hypothetical protein MCAP1_002118 [Malassezia caprae]|uniref:Uncharacterized protein n=1 Tax=Malassezia caprae TaxID=1381934 RepID=A0AAF0E937_9BASI|nr:hypothetical protein MCAP1_002118 [Malassezia caprae]